MLNTKAVFERLGLGSSGGRALQTVRDLVDGSSSPTAKATELIKTITGVERKFDDDQIARLTAMAVAEGAFKLNHEIADPEVFVNGCMVRIETMRADPKNSFMFVKKSTVIPTEEKAVAEGVEMKVAVKQDGTIKKGGKQILAAELYKKHVLEAATPATNQAFIAVLVKELGMSKAGATTYAYNCKKQLGEPKGGIVKAKKGRKAKV